MARFLPNDSASRLHVHEDLPAGCPLQREVPARHMPQWPELSVKIIYPQMLAAHLDLAQYLPDPQVERNVLSYEPVERAYNHRENCKQSVYESSH